MSQCDFQRAMQYISLAKTIAEDGLKVFGSDLHLNALLGSAYIVESYDKRIEMFKTIGRGGTMSDRVYCLVGQVETELLYNDNPNWTSLIDMLMQAYNLQKNGPEMNPQNTLLLKVLTFGALTKTLKRAKLPDMALHYAQELAKLTEDKEFVYCCVGVSSTAVESVAEVFLEQGHTDDFMKLFPVIHKMAGYYKMVRAVEANISKKFKELYPDIAYDFLKDYEITPTIKFEELETSKLATS